jgi:hypothetical protein
VSAENALRARPKDEEALKDEQIKTLKQKIGDLVLDLDTLKEAMKDRPFPRGCPTSEGPHERVSQRRLCRLLAVARSCARRPPNAAPRSPSGAVLADRVAALIDAPVGTP